MPHQSPEDAQPIFNIEKDAVERAKKALSLSRSHKRYQAMINLLDQAGIVLPDTLKQHIDDPKLYPEETQLEKFGEVTHYLDVLVSYFKKEAVAKDKLSILKNLKILPSSELYQEISAHIDLLYSDNITENQYTKTINALKIIILTERLRHALPEHHKQLADNLAYQHILKDFIENPNAEKSLNDSIIEKLEQDGIAVPQNFFVRSTSFISLRAIDTPQKMHDNHVGKILDVMNDAFKREMIVLNDLRETILTGNEQLFRGLRMETNKDTIEQFFNNPHRIRDNDTKNELFLFDADRSWSPALRSKGQVIEYKAVFTSFNQYWALHFMQQHKDNSGLMLHIVPSKNKTVLYGINDNETEVAINQIDPREIRAIYELRNGKVIGVHLNPNYESTPQDKPLIFKLGEDLKDVVSLSAQDVRPENEEAFKKYKQVKFDKSRSPAPNSPDESLDEFHQRYKQKDVTSHRERLLAKRNFKNNQEKLAACISKDVYSMDMSVLYRQLHEAINANPVEQVKVEKLLRDTPIATGRDSEGNNLLMLAAKFRHVDMIDFVIQHTAIDLKALNRRNETAFYIAVQNGLDNIPQALSDSANIAETFLTAARYCELSMLEALLKRYHLSSKDKEEALALSIRNEDKDSFTLLLESLKNEVSPQGIAAIQFILNHQATFCETLLKSNLKSSLDFAPSLIFATESGQPKLINTILTSESGKNIPENAKMHAFLAAVKKLESLSKKPPKRKYEMLKKNILKSLYALFQGDASQQFLLLCVEKHYQNLKQILANAIHYENHDLAQLIEQKLLNNEGRKPMSLHDDLLKLCGSEANISSLIKAISHDRFTGETTTLAVLSGILEPHLKDPKKVNGSTVNAELATSDPLLYIMLTMVVEYDKKGVDSTQARDLAAKKYKETYKTDKRFEHHYFYSRSPLPLLTHLFLTTERLAGSYDGQMMDLYKGKFSFPVGTILTADTVKRIQQIESPTNKSFPSPFISALKENADGTYVAERKVLTPSLRPIEQQLDLMYTEARRAQQKSIVMDYANHLQSTSQKISSGFEGKQASKNALVIIGPYGSGKTTFVNRQFHVSESKGELISLSADALTAHLRDKFPEKSTRSDFHFEGCILKEDIDNSQFNNLFATGAFIDERRFSQAMTDFFRGRSVSMIEIATENAQDSAIRLCNREKLTDLNSSEFTQSVKSSNEAQATRMARITKAIEHSKTKNDFKYELRCNTLSQKGEPEFVLVCEVSNGTLTIHNDALYKKLTDPSLVAGLDKVQAIIELQKGKQSPVTQRHDFFSGKTRADAEKTKPSADTDYPRGKQNNM